jgi:putative transposase
VLVDLRHLDRYPWAGHSALLGTVARPWQDTATILTQFGTTRRRALAAYRAFVVEGLPQGRRPELRGGGLVRSLGGWAAVAARQLLAYISSYVFPTWTTRAWPCRMT